MPNSPRTQMAQRNQQWTNQQNLKWNNRMMGEFKVSNGNSREKIAKEEQTEIRGKITQLSSDLEKQRNVIRLKILLITKNDYSQKKGKTKEQIAKTEEN
jgi:hypothetical protein